MSQKKLNGIHVYHKKEDISTKKTYNWLERSELFPETGGFLFAVQD